MIHASMLQLAKHRRDATESWHFRFLIGVLIDSSSCTPKGREETLYDTI